LINHPEDRQQSIVLDVQFGPDDIATSIHSDGRIATWVVVDRSPLWTPIDVDGAIADIARTDAELVSAGSSGVQSTSIVRGETQMLRPGRASAVAVDEPTGRVLVGEPGGGVVVVDPSGVSEELPGHNGAVNAVVWAAGGTVAVSAGDDGLILMTDPTTGITIERAHAERYVADVAVSPDGAWLATVGFDRTVRLWSVPDGEPLGVFLAHTGSVDSLAVHPGGERVATGSDDRSIIIWDVETGTVVDRLTGHTDRVVSLAYSDDGTRIVSGSEDRTVILWDLAESLVVGQPLSDEFSTLPSALTFSPGSVDRFYVGSAGIAAWDLSPKRLESEGCAIAAGRAVSDAERQRYFTDLDPRTC
jgi:WD40 repeat protein